MNEDKKRIYGTPVAISPEIEREFWKKRSEMYSEKGINAVICGNQDGERAEKENRFDQEHLIPLLGLEKDSRVLDIGCGVGRITKMVLPLCGFYCGTDFTEGMVEITEDICRQLRGGGQIKNRDGEGYSCHQMSCFETAEKPADFFGGCFDTMIMLNVSMYANDAELEGMYKNMPKLLKEHASIWFMESIALEERLTLDRFPSEALNMDYSAIYRTKEEYLELYKPLFDAGFDFVEEALFPSFGHAWTETDRWYCILRR